MQAAWAYASEQREREENEDSFGLFQFGEVIVFVVCDGMGGHAGGRQASSLAVRTLHEQLGGLAAPSPKIPETLTEAVKAANVAIFEAARRHRHLIGMGTTVVMVAVHQGQAYTAHVGDSRAYLFRHKQAQQLTRDHTMVNLFVDAELLSPEEAASHPEAHVLARSMGVERAVEVEVGGPFPLEAGDALLVCSDGVHGVVSEEDMADLDWAQPQEAVRRIVWAVREREGDDNATLVALTYGVADSLSAPIPPLPELADMGEGAGKPSAPRVATPAPAAPSIATAQAPLPMPPSALQKPAMLPENTALPGTAAPQVPAAPATGRRKKKAQQANRLRVALLGALVGATALAGVVMVQRLGPGRAPPAPPQAPQAALLAVETPSAAPAEIATAEDPLAAEASAAPEDTVAEAVPRPAYILGVSPPEAPRRPPHRPTRFIASPPGGAPEFQAIQAARAKECARSMQIVREAERQSPDYAALYPQAWECFNVAHQRHLVEARVNTWDDLQPLLAHLHGDIPEGPGPVWARPAPSGVEARLDAWRSAAPDALLVAALSDRVGPGRLADHLGVDLLIEAQLAAGLAGWAPEEPDPAWVDAWARAVYYAARSLQDPVGELVAAHRPDLHALIVEQLAPATLGGWGDPEIAATLPRPVQEALAVARGEQPPPIVEAPKPKPKPKPPPPPPEPETPPEGIDDGSMPVIHRRGN